jgi:hypothetical protein
MGTSPATAVTSSVAVRIRLSTAETVVLGELVQVVGTTFAIAGRWLVAVGILTGHRQSYRLVRSFDCGSLLHFSNCPRAFTSTFRYGDPANWPLPTFRPAGRQKVTVTFDSLLCLTRQYRNPKRMASMSDNRQPTNICNRYRERGGPRL